MSRTRNYTEDTIATMTRFFDILDDCIANGTLKNITTFCTVYNIDRRHFYAQRKDRTRGYFESGWLTPLVNDFNVSAKWLLTGRGERFSKRILN